MQINSLQNTVKGQNFTKTYETPKAKEINIDFTQKSNQLAAVAMCQGCKYV